MLKKNPPIAAQNELFQVRLETIIDSRHELVKIAALVDWDDLAADLSAERNEPVALPMNSQEIIESMAI